MPMTDTTELEAINSMLRVIGQSPISTLLVVGSVNVANAKATLLEVSREVQEEGWEFNNEAIYPLVPDQDGFIFKPANCLKIDASDPQVHYTERTGKIYDKTNHTFVFTETKHFDITWGFDYEELPQVVRHYIMIKAARRFGEQSIGASEMRQYSMDDELEARAKLQSTDGANADYNILDSHDVATILDR